MNIYEQINEQILTDLKKGIIPWHVSWKITGDGIISHLTGKPYSFINSLLINRAGEYATFNQIQKLGGKVKKGAHGEAVYFYKPIEKKEIKDGKEEIKKSIILKKYFVFNLLDVEGVNPRFKDRWGGENNNVNEKGNFEQANKVYEGYIQTNKIVVKYEGSQPHYKVGKNIVVIPKCGNFETTHYFYSALFHELGHSTGEPERLNRKCFVNYGQSKKERAREELVAELTAAYICGRLGIRDNDIQKDNTAYIQGWIKNLTDDPTAFYWCASQAEKAAKLIFNDKVTTTEGV